MSAVVDRVNADSAAARYLDGLNDAQREAASATTGPVAILAGAGTGKTRVISHRVGYAVATGVVRPQNVLLVTFTDKAAGEMVERLRGLGLPGVSARTFHAAARAQLAYYWPRHHEGAPPPDILDSKLPVIGRLARALPGGYRFTASKDLADEIEWAKSRRIDPGRYAQEAAGTGGRTPPIPVELFVRLFADYERQKSRMGRIDFEDMLALAVGLLETDEQALTEVQGKYRWFSVDEYQDTNPLQQALLELWVGERRDLCVVGDEDQTIYTFTGATSRFLTDFAERWPDARTIALTENYRSTPQILELANRVIAVTGRSKRLTATRDGGPAPQIRTFADDEDEVGSIVGEVRRLLAEGVPASEVAVLVRLNAQIPPIEQALTLAAIPYQVRGQRFYDRQEIRQAIGLVRRRRVDATGQGLINAVRELWRDGLGFDPDDEPEGREERERHASLLTLLGILRAVVARAPAVTAADFLAELDTRASSEAEGSASGVVLSTLHRAKGLEWDAVFLPALEEGLLPVHQSGDDDEALGEERRLLYVGITRARKYLTLSWARRRTNANGREQTRRMSRFLHGLSGTAGQPRPTPPGMGVQRIASASSAAGQPAVEDSPLLAALKEWRRQRAKDDGVPAYVVLHDSTLAEICDRPPQSVAELRRVKGFGPAKLEKYGEEILEVVRLADG